MNEDKKRFIKQLDKQNDYVKQANAKLCEYYGKDYKPTYISKIIDGENIDIDDENILITKPILEDEPFKDVVNKIFEKTCNLKPYKYQVQTINRILELESIQRRKYNDKTIVSNIYQISLPIGSGKSLVFEILSLFFRTVKQHPIIVSTNGQFLPKHDQLPFELYPFYYENGAYIEEEANAIQAITTPDNYQRHTTVILTHHHLLVQLYEYFNNDFKPEIIKNTRFGYFDYHQITNEVDPEKFDIMVAVADDENVNKLIELSYKKPFCRVIVDDYTNMVALRYMKQILSFSTLLVSGHGFEKSIGDVPVSYYSMKNIPTKMITLVGNPNEVYEGVFRDNVLTGELLGCYNEMNVYNFVQEIDEACKRIVFLDKNKKRIAHTSPELFEEIRETGTLNKYIKYGFFIKNISLLRDKVSELINDIKESDKNNRNFPKVKVSNFLKWYSKTNDEEFKNLLKTPSISNSTSTIVNTLVDFKCYICGKTKDKHLGFGIVSGCCGSFICSNCIKEASTCMMKNNDGDVLIADVNYCCCCRSKSPNYYFNTTRQSASSNVFSYVLAQQYFSIGTLINNFPIDYYFFMLLNDGFNIKREYWKGEPLNLTNDIEFGMVSNDVFKTKTIPEITKIKSIDILGGQILTAMRNVYIELKIKPSTETSFVLMVGVKPIIQTRLNSLFERLKRGEDSPYKNTKLMFIENVSSVIGIQANILGIVVWDNNMEQGDISQLCGRIFRIQKINKDMTFFIKLNKTAYN